MRGEDCEFCVFAQDFCTVVGPEFQKSDVPHIIRRVRILYSQAIDKGPVFFSCTLSTVYKKKRQHILLVGVILHGHFVSVSEK